MVTQADFIAAQHLNTLRKQLRKQRRAVNKFQHKQSELKVLQQLLLFAPFRSSQKIGLYLDAFGEIHTANIIRACFRLKKTVFLPKICNMNGRLIWVKITAHQYNNQRFTQHRLGMQEPAAERAHSVSHLDVLFMPLLGCDRKGTRLGMGGGYYDRTLASAEHRPIRVGIAHNFQLLDKNLEQRPWDQPLDFLVTPKRLYRFKP